MTREEAMELLKELNPHVPNYDEAIEMAIEALKAQQCVVKAIQKIQNINADDYSEYPDHFKAGVDKAIEIIKQEISGVRMVDE